MLSDFAASELEALRHYWDRFDGPVCEFPSEVAVGRYEECRAELRPRQGRSRAMRMGARGRLWAVTAPSEGSDRQRPPTAFMQVSPPVSAAP